MEQQDNREQNGLPPHTPEPWRLAGQGDGAQQLPILSSDGKIIAAIRDHGHLSDGYRIVACVNGCAGINPEAVPMMFEALREVRDFKVRYRKGAGCDELLSAITTQFEVLQARTRAAIAKTEVAP